MSQRTRLDRLLDGAIRTLETSCDASADCIADYLNGLRSSATVDPHTYTVAFICEEMESVIGWAQHVIKTLTAANTPTPATRSTRLP